MKFYCAAISGNSHKVRILLALLKIPHEKILLDLTKKEHKAPWFLKINPRGEVPALEDGGVIRWDSAACLVYLARKYGGESWLSTAPEEMSEVVQWLALAASELQCGLQYARRGVMQGRWTAGTLEQGQAIGRVALAAMEERLQKNDWLALDHPTIADIACFAYAETAPESRVPLDPYPNIVAWLARCKALPGWPER